MVVCRTQQADEFIVRERAQHLTTRLADGEVTLHPGHFLVVEDAPGERGESNRIGMVRWVLVRHGAPFRTRNPAGVLAVAAPGHALSGDTLVVEPVPDLTRSSDRR
jgi:hypothetical protein